MRRYSNRLVARQVVTISEPGMHADGNGLYLRVRPNGTRSWIFVAIVGGQRREMGLGIPRNASLTRVRELATNAGRAFAEGRDPIAERAAAKPKPAAPAVARVDATNPTFWAFADKLIEDIEEGFRNEKHRKPWRSTLKTRSSCLVPAFAGASSAGEWKDALWARFYTGAPARQRRSAERTT